MAAGEAVIFGTRVEPLVFGFAGGVVSLRYMKELTPLQAALAVFTGLFVSWAFTPLAMAYLHLPELAGNGTAFLLGLTAMNIVPGFVKLSERFRKNPEQYVPHATTQHETTETGDK